MQVSTKLVASGEKSVSRMVGPSTEFEIVLDLEVSRQMLLSAELVYVYLEFAGMD